MIRQEARAIVVIRKKFLQEIQLDGLHLAVQADLDALVRQTMDDSA
jgi:tRNA splicing ligase